MSNRTASIARRSSSASRIEQAVQLRAAGLSFEKISKRVGASVHTLRRDLYAAADLGGALAEHTTGLKRRYRRACLCCRTAIIVDSPYLRLCVSCRRNAGSWLA